MKPLNFPHYPLRVKDSESGVVIFDILRKKYLRLTPEEWVRQHCLHYLATAKHYPLSRMAIEKAMRIGTLLKRTDLLVFDAWAKPYILVECKAPRVEITQKTFDQVNRYNQVIKAPYLFLTNGIEHVFCAVNHETNEYRFLEALPKYT